MHVLASEPYQYEFPGDALEQASITSPMILSHFFVGLPLPCFPLAPANVCHVVFLTGCPVASSPSVVSAFGFGLERRAGAAPNDCCGLPSRPDDLLDCALGLTFNGVADAGSIGDDDALAAECQLDGVLEEGVNVSGTGVRIFPLSPDTGMFINSSNSSAKLFFLPSVLARCAKSISSFVMPCVSTLVRFTALVESLFLKMTSWTN